MTNPKDVSVENIRKELNDRLNTQVNSMCATGDEISLAYLLCEISKLKERIEELEMELRVAGEFDE